MTEAQTDNLPNEVSSDHFLQAIYANGGGASMDGIGYHAYPDASQTDPLARVKAITSAIRTVRNANGDSKKRLWLTEFGACGVDPASGVPYPSGHHYVCPTNSGSWSEELQGSDPGQGAILTQGLQWMRSQPDLAAGIIHALFEFGPRQDPFTWAPGSGSGQDPGYHGLIEFATDPTTSQVVIHEKPAFCQVARAVAGTCG